MSYVAEQIPEDISYLLIGECHYLPDMPKTVSDLISYLHYVYQPGREIIVLTEFLPEMVTWGQPGPVSTWDIYVNLWGSLQGMGGIPAIGMEPAFKFNDSASEIITEEPQSPTTRDFIADISEGETSYTPAERDTSSQIASSPEGVRLRNERFLQIIKQVRQEHPDALLVIYTGGAHVEYGQPYSLGDALAGPKTRVISLIPAPVQKDGEWYAPAVNFDIATRMQFIFDRLIQFNDPELTKLSGADIRWKIPIVHLPK
ncbi:MAG: hypothetical protein MJ053_03545 [Elusimicrobiaceae bacterium]|nr:hypothetical protein [Elusimicrobiaceae bacterium]